MLKDPSQIPGYRRPRAEPPGECQIRDGQVTNRPVYTAIGATVDGNRDVLGLWVGTGGEGAKWRRSGAGATGTISERTFITGRLHELDP